MRAAGRPSESGLALAVCSSAQLEKRSDMPREEIAFVDVSGGGNGRSVGAERARGRNLEGNTAVDDVSPRVNRRCGTSPRPMRSAGVLRLRACDSAGLASVAM